MPLPSAAHLGGHTVKSDRLWIQARLSTVVIALMLFFGVPSAQADGTSAAKPGQGLSTEKRLDHPGQHRGWERGKRRHGDKGHNGTPGGSENPGGGGSGNPGGGGSGNPGGGGSGDHPEEPAPAAPSYYDPPASPHSPTNEAPEPATWLLLGSGAAALWAARPRKRD
jgi:hypothetical protein